MRALIAIALVWLSSGALVAQPRANVVSNVFLIRFNGEIGSSFVFTYGDRQYLVTANHVVKKAGDHARIDVLLGNSGEWGALEVDVLHGPNQCMDVAVLVPPQKKLSESDPIPLPYSAVMGQEVFFLGFPFGLYASFDGKSGIAPLIKHGYLSAMAQCSALYPDGSRDERLYLLDGLNNPGFSGGPVVAPNESLPGRPQYLIGVVTSYRNQEVPIKVNGKEMPNASVETNAGIILAVPIEKAIDLIKQHLEEKAANK